MDQQLATALKAAILDCVKGAEDARSGQFALDCAQAARTLADTWAVLATLPVGEP